MDTTSGELDVLAPKGESITGPDDVAFDSLGNLYVTEVMSARVTMRKPNGVIVSKDRLSDEHRLKVVYLNFIFTILGRQV